MPHHRVAFPARPARRGPGRHPHDSEPERRARGRDCRPRLLYLYRTGKATAGRHPRPIEAAKPAGLSTARLKQERGDLARRATETGTRRRARPTSPTRPARTMAAARCLRSPRRGTPCAASSGRSMPPPSRSPWVPACQARPAPWRRAGTVASRSIRATAPLEDSSRRSRPRSG